MTDPQPRMDPAASAFLALYDQALTEVYGYVRRRVNSDQVAEDVTAETFLAAVADMNKRQPGEAPAASVPWLIGVARNKVVDHWRRCEREQRRADALKQAASVAPPTEESAPSDFVVEADLADWTLARLTPGYRAALTLRYLDDLPVKEVADHLDRTLGATEALLTRAKAAFRQNYPDDQLTEPKETTQ